MTVYFRNLAARAGSELWAASHQVVVAADQLARIIKVVKRCLSPTNLSGRGRALTARALIFLSKNTWTLAPFFPTLGMFFSIWEFDSLEKMLGYEVLGMEYVIPIGSLIGAIAFGFFDYFVLRYFNWAFEDFREYETLIRNKKILVEAFIDAFIESDQPISMLHQMKIDSLVTHLFIFNQKFEAHFSLPWDEEAKTRLMTLHTEIASLYVRYNELVLAQQHQERLQALENLCTHFDILEFARLWPFSLEEESCLIKAGVNAAKANSLVDGIEEEAINLSLFDMLTRSIITDPVVFGPYLFGPEVQGASPRLLHSVVIDRGSLKLLRECPICKEGIPCHKTVHSDSKAAADLQCLREKYSSLYYI